MDYRNDIKINIQSDELLKYLLKIGTTVLFWVIVILLFNNEIILSQ